MTVLIKASYSFDPIDVKNVFQPPFMSKIPTEIQSVVSVRGAHL